MIIAWLAVCLFALTIGAARSEEGQEGFGANDPVVPDFKLTAFYDTGLDYIGKNPGEIIKTESIGAPDGAVAWRVMYVSRTWDDRLVPVTGIVVAPKAASAKPRPVLTWAHGTTGGARVCAPSLAENPARNLVERSAGAPIDYGVPYLTEFLKRGFVVVATDYYGHGAPGVHHYVVGDTVGRNALDMVRAAQAIKETNAGQDVVAFGWSQGGHAALFAGEIQPNYAPELKLKGVVTSAPGGVSMLTHPVEIPHIYLIARAYQDAYNVPLSEFTEEGKKLVEAAGNMCVVSVFRKSLELKGPFVTAEWSPEFKRAFDVNHPGQRKSGAPVLVVHGTSDNVVVPEETKALEQRARSSGTDIKVSWYDGGTHRSTVTKAEAEILAWIEERLKD